MFFSPSAAAWLFRIIFFFFCCQTNFFSHFFFLYYVSLLSNTHIASAEKLDFSTHFDWTRLDFIFLTFPTTCDCLALFTAKLQLPIFLISCLSDSIFQHWTQNYPLVFQLFHHTQSNLGHSSRFLCTLSSLVCAGLLGGIARTRWLFQLNLIIYNVRHRALCTTFILFFFDRHFFDLFLFAYCTFRLHSTVTLINFPPRSRASSVKLQ